MSMNANLYRTYNIHEKTPVSLYEQLNKEFNFNYDPCPYKSEVDGLNIDWGKRCFINPPYGKEIPKWLDKALYEIALGHTEIAVFLLPAYTDVRWFHDIILKESKDIRFIKGRLKFGDHKEAAPFGSMIVVLRLNND